MEVTETPCWDLAKIMKMFGSEAVGGKQPNF